MTGYSNICAAVLMLVLATTAAHATVEISTKPTSNMTCSGGVCSPTAKKAKLNVAELQNMLATGDVIIESDHVSKDIDIDAAVTWTSTSRLVLDSFRSIAFNKPVVVAGIGALTITTNQSKGDFQFFNNGHVEFANDASDLVINGKHYLLVRTLKDAAREVTRNPSGFFALAGNINARRFGTYDTSPVSTVIEGAFEGLGNTVSNLSIQDQNDTVNVGLFAILGLDATIRDVGVVNVTVRGIEYSQNVGGLLGGGIGNVVNCFVTGTVTSTGPDSNVGGLVGGTAGAVKRSHSSATVVASGQASPAGGLVGSLEFSDNQPATVSESYSSGSVTGGDDVPVGGLVGLNSASVISNSYSSAAVSGGSSTSVGGLVGSLTAAFGVNPVVTTSYSTGSVLGGSSGASVGGLVGQDTVGTGIANSYWDLDSSGVSDPSKGAGNVANDPGITGLTDVQLKSGLPSGFKNKVWTEKASINNGYPYLAGNPPPN